VIEQAYPGQQLEPSAPSRDTTAVMGRRVAAWVLDLLLYLGLAIALFFALSEWVPVPAGFVSDPCAMLELEAGEAAKGCMDLGDRAYITSDTDNRIQTAASVVYFAFFVVVQGLTGASPGKFITGLRVVDEHGNRAGIGRSLVRTVLWVVDAAPWIVPLVGFIVGLTNTGHRRVGDLAAKTFVVHKRDLGTPPLATATTAPAATWGAPPPDAWNASPPTAVPGWSWDQSATATPSPGEQRSEVGEQPPSVPEQPAAAEEPPRSFAAPGSDPIPPAASAPTAAAMPPPQWDPARGTYLQWDPTQQRWLQWDGIANRWKVIDT
jgi:hypothetical protein